MPRLLAIGGGVIVLFIGVALFSSRLVRPLASSWAGRRRASPALPGDWRATTPCATRAGPPVTAAALMIGIALVTFVAVLGQGLRASYGSSFEDQVDTTTSSPSDDTFSPFAPEAGNALRRDPDVDGADVDPRGPGPGLRREGRASTASSRRRSAASTTSTGTRRSTPSSRGSADGAIVSRSFADDHALAVGSTVPSRSAPDGTRLNLTVERHRQA